MQNKINEKVSVDFIYNHLTNKFFPHKLRWKTRTYIINKVGLHYTLYRGNTLFHMFAVVSSNCFFLLAFNTASLTWTLEEIGDNTFN